MLGEGRSGGLQVEGDQVIKGRKEAREELIPRTAARVKSPPAPIGRGDPRRRHPVHLDTPPRGRPGAAGQHEYAMSNSLQDPAASETADIPLD